MGLHLLQGDTRHAGNSSDGVQISGTGTPAGVAGWWQASGNANDSAGSDNGTLHGTVGFVPGDVSLSEAARRVGDATNARELRDALGGRVHDDAVAESLLQLDRLGAEAEAVRAVLTNGAGRRARDKAGVQLRQLERRTARLRLALADAEGRLEALAGERKPLDTARAITAAVAADDGR